MFFTIMNNLEKRIALFLLLCMPSRLIFAYVSKTASEESLKLMGLLALLPAIGFSYIYVSNSRKVGAETFGAKIWWNDLRPLHSLLYFTFSYMALTNTPNAYKALVLDALIGFITFTLHHTKK